MRIYILILIVISSFINLNSQVLTQGSIIKTGDNQVTVYAKPDISITTTFLNNQFTLSIPTPSGGQTLPILSIDQNYIPNLSWDILTPYELSGRTYWDVLGSDNSLNTTVTWTANTDNPMISISFSGSDIINTTIQMNDLSANNGGNNNQSYWYLSVINDVCNCVPGGDITDYDNKFYGDLYMNGGSSGNSYAETVQPVALPLSILDFDIQKYQSNSVKLFWKTDYSSDLTYFSIESNLNYSGWKQIGNVLSGDHDINFTNSYSFIDFDVFTGIENIFLQYRLKYFNSDGEFQYSDIKNIDFMLNTQSGSLEIYPNPSKDNFYFSIENIESGKNLELKIFDLMGKLIFENKISYNDQQNILINLKNNELTAGMYQVMIREIDTGKLYKNKIVVPE